MIYSRLYKVLPLVLALLLVSSFYGCQSNSKKIKVAASSVPHAEILEHVREELKKEGVSMVIVEIDDYALPNRLLNEGVVDANFFQHVPYLEEEKKNFGYSLSSIAKVHIEPLALYSTKITDIDQLPDRAIVALPSDPSNQTRALRLLEDEGLISLKEGSKGQFISLLDINYNPKYIKIEELDAALLTHTLPDVDAAIIPGNYAFQRQGDEMHLLVQESARSDYVNVLVVRTSDQQREELRLLAELLTSDEIKEFLKQKYQNRLIPPS